MNKKELRHLSRKELIELLIAAKKENETLKSQIDSNNITFPDKRYEQLLEVTKSAAKSYLIRLSCLGKETPEKQGNDNGEEKD